MRCSRDEVASGLLEPLLGGHVAEGVDRAFAEVHAGGGEPELPALDRQRHRHRPGEGVAGLHERNVRAEQVPGGNDSLDPAAIGVLLGHAGDQGGGRIPVADEAGPVEEDDSVGDVRERACCVRPLLGLLEEARVVDRDPGAAGELEGEVEVGLRKRADRLGGDERDRAPASGRAR